VPARGQEGSAPGPGAEPPAEAQLALPELPVEGDAAGGADGNEPAAEAGADDAQAASPPPSPGELPAAQPDANLAPVIAESAGAAPRSVPPSERPEAVLRTILGLLALLALAYLAGHPAVLRWEERLGISQVITAGFPFVVLGVVARHPSVGILNDRVLSELAPLLRLGLGWIGFVVGFRFETRLFQGLPRGAGTVVLLSTLLPFAAVVAAFVVLLPLLTDVGRQLGLNDPVFVRDALILGTAGAMTALPVASLFADRRTLGVVARIIRLEEMAGVLGLALIAAYFRPQGPEISWQLPGTGWLFLTLGLGTTLGLVVYAILLRPASRAEFLVLTLGSISFAAGAAGYLRISSVVVAFVAGVLLANFPGAYHQRMRDMLLRLERPIYLISLLIIGALWDVGDWRGWVLMPVFMALRLGAKWLAASVTLRTGGLELSGEERSALAVAPIGPLAIAIVVNALLLYPGGSISLIVSAVIGGGVLTEVFVQLARRVDAWRRRRMPASVHHVPLPVREREAVH
jgi:Kef-type K+ transport system membrane component KefB